MGGGAANQWFPRKVRPGVKRQRCGRKATFAEIAGGLRRGGEGAAGKFDRNRRASKDATEREGAGAMFVE